MQESQVLEHLKKIGTALTSGRSREYVFDMIVEAIQALGFDRVRLDLVSPDGAVLSPVVLRGFNGEGASPIPTKDDPDFSKLSAEPHPMILPKRAGQPERCCIPLLLRGKVIGQLSMDNALTGRQIPTDRLDLVSLFASQAVATETASWADSLEALQQTTLAITSIRDRETLLRTIIEQAVKLLGAKSGGIYEYKPELGELKVIADFGRSANVGITLRIGEGMAGRLVESGEPYMIVYDYSIWPGKAAIWEGDLFGSVLEVPLHWENRVLGVLYVDDEVGRRFNESDARLLRLFADEASITLFNSSLLSADERKLKRLETLAQFTREMMGNLGAMPLQDRLMLIARHTVEILNAETSSVFLVRDREDELVLEASYGQPDEFVTGARKLRIHNKPEGGLTGYIAYQGALFNAHGADLTTHWTTAQISEVHTPSGYCYSLLAIPLKKRMNGENKLIGLLRADNKKGEGGRALPTLGFTQEDEWILAIFAEAAVVAIESAEMVEIKERREKLLEALVQASIHIRAEMEMPKLLQGIVRLAAELVGCQAGGLFLNRPHLGQLELAAIYGLPDHLLSEHLSYESSVIGLLAQEEMKQIEPEREELLQYLGLQRGAIVPLRKSTGEVEAILVVGDTIGPGSLSWTDVRILQDFATQAAIALRTSRLMDREQRMFSQVVILHRISDYIQVEEDMEKILHAVLTGVTASYGLGFNRAILLLVDEQSEYLVGRMGIGHSEYEQAQIAWKADTERGLNHFEGYLEQLEKGQIETTTVGRRTIGLHFPLGGEDLFSEVVSQRRFGAIATDEFERVPIQFLKTFQVTTPLAVAPLVVKEQVIGILVVDNKFTNAPIVTSDLDSLMTLASTAAITLDNKKLLQQTRSGAEKLLAFYTMTAELITLREPRQILRMIVEQTLQTAGASWVSIVLIDEAGRASNPISVGHRPTANLQNPFAIRQNGISMQVMVSGRAFPIENVERTEGVHPSLMQRDIKAAICLPLSLPGRRIGVVWIHYNEPRRFPDTEVAALQLYANQAAIAYDSARRMERLASLSEASEALAATNEMSGVLQQIVDSARSVLEADATALWFYDAERDTFIPERAAYSGAHQLSWESLRQKGPQPRGTAYRLMDQGRFIAEDVGKPEQIERLGPWTRAFIEEIGGRAFQGLTLKIGRERLGVLYAIYDQPRTFDRDDRDTALTFANRAAMALTKVKLIEQVRRATKAADSVAKVTVLEHRESTFVTIVHETQEATECGAVSLFEYDRRSGKVRHPPTMAGVWDTERVIREDESDYSIVYSMLERDEPYIAEDITYDESFKSRRFAQVEAIKACVAIPLKVASSKVGVMFLNYRTKRRFIQAELDNMMLFANQAAVAIRNAQLFDDLSTKLYQQRTLVMLSQELLGARTVQETMDRAVIVAAAALNAEFSNLVLPDQEGRLFFSAAFGWEPELVGNYELQPGNRSQTGITVQQRKPIAVENYTKIDFTVPDIVFTHGIRSGLSAPMFRESEVVGAILVHTKRARRFTEDDEVLLSLIANETALAIESARQHEASVRWSRHLNALYEASKAITAQFGLERRKILDQIVQSAVEGITGVSGAKAILGTLQLFDETKDELVLESVYPREQYDKLAHKIGKPVRGFLRERRPFGITGRTLKTGRSQLVKDVREDPDYVVHDPATLSDLMVPLLDQRKVIGVLNVESDKVCAFDEEDKEALQALAELAVVAIQNARHLDELKETKQLVNTRTTLAWMGIGNAARRHEMAGYVGIIRSDLGLLTKELKKLSLSRDVIERILDRIGRMARAAANMNRTLSEKPGTQVQSILINKELVQSWAKNLDANRFDPPIDFQTRCGLGDFARVRANVFWLKQVLDIIVNNAVRATEGAPERSILLGTRSRDRRAEIYVEDNGSGIAEPIRSKLFREPIEKTEGEEGEGLGMGLLIAHAIVQTYNGNMYIEDREPNGTIIVISLPMERSAGRRRPLKLSKRSRG